MSTHNSKKRILAVLLLAFSLIIVFGVSVLLQVKNFSDQSRASSGTILIGKLIKSTDLSCTKCVEQCPGKDNVLRSCSPMESDGTSVDSLCNSAGRVVSCGSKNYCCPSANGKWTTDLAKCPGAVIPPKSPAAYKLLKDGGSCVAIVASKTLAEPLVGKQVVATGSLQEPYFYASQLTLNKCVEQCPGKDNVLRNCHPAESDGTSEDSTCNTAGRIAACGGISFCCPTPNSAWTKDLTKCPSKK